jgi:hypothetical protein
MNFGSEVDRLKELASFKSDDDHERALSGLMDKVADHSLRPLLLQNRGLPLLPLAGIEAAASQLDHPGTNDLAADHMGMEAT